MNDGKPTRHNETPATVRGPNYFLPGDVGKGEALRLRHIRKVNPVPRFPRDVQIQTRTGCNAACRFCPHPVVSRKLSSGTMPRALYEKIVDECCANKVHRISPYLMNEPLLDPEMPKRIRTIASRKKGGTHIKMNTNGALLKGEMAEGIVDSGLDRLHISFHGINKETYERSMKGLDFDETMENVQRYIELWKAKGKPHRFKVTMVRTSLVGDEADAIKRYWKDLGLDANIRPLSNRASGRVEDRSLAARPWVPYSWCIRMMKQAYILYNGDMILCCSDWERTTVLGNVGDRSIEEIWNNDRYNDIRRRFIAGDTEGLLCHTCKMPHPDDGD